MSTVPATGVLTLAEVRTIAAGALAPGPDDPDVEVLVNLVDSITPPALMVGWGDPWIAAEPATMGRTLFRARLVLWVIAGRLEPGPGVEVLETLVAYAMDRLSATPYPWGLPAVSAPRVFPIGNLDYLGSQVAYLVPVTTSEG